MNPQVNEWLNLAFRWIHVIAGVMWIGHLWFFNFVNAQVAKTYDADSKKKVVPELMPRALYWFRWGAAWTFITGFLLLGIVYYMGGSLVPIDGSTVSNGVGTIIGIASLIVGFAVYDILWKTMGKNEMVAAIISFLLISGAAIGLGQVFVGRAVYMHVGAIFGTIMAGNVWMRIWPSQRKIITAIKGGTAPDAAVVALAGLRSKHNTYMSVPLLLLMVSNHFPGVYGESWGIYAIPGFIAVGWFLAKRMYVASAQASAAQF